MRPSLRLTVAGIGVAAPAGAQEALGFEINITEGGPGEIVAGQVDTDDVAEHCTTDVEELQSLEGRFFLGLAQAVEVAFGFTAIFGQDPPVVPTSFEQVTAVLYALIALGVAFDAELAEDVLAQTFVMTFADIDTQEPVGEMGNFDPDTGEGTVVVPDIEPGLWAVAAACVSPSMDEAVIQAALSEAAAFLEEEVDLSGFGFSEPFPTADELVGAALGGNEDFLALLQEIGPSLLAPLMVPNAFGAQIFCILDAEGLCPADEVPPVPDDLEAPGPARPVVVQPAFTG